MCIIYIILIIIKKSICVKAYANKLCAAQKQKTKKKTNNSIDIVHRQSASNRNIGNPNDPYLDSIFFVLIFINNKLASTLYTHINIQYISVGVFSRKPLKHTHTDAHASHIV